MDIPSLALAGLLGMGFYGIWKGNLLIPAWYTFWYASSIIAGVQSRKGKERSEQS